VSGGAYLRHARLGRAPVIGLFLMVQVLNASGVRGVAVFLRPVDRFVVGLEAASRWSAWSSTT
jgi:hypothetical protein